MSLALPKQSLHPKWWPTWLLVALIWLITRLPHRGVVAVGQGLGWLFYKIGGKRKHICTTNIALCFPELGENERAALVRRTMIDQGIGMMETAEALLKSPEKIGARLNYIGAEHLEQREGRGLLVITFHFTGLYFAATLFGLDYTADSFYRPNKNPVLEWLFGRIRGSYGESVERRDVKKAIRSLRKGKRLIYLPDQDYGSQSAVFVPFFGVPAATITGARSFATVGKSDVVFLQVKRRDGGRIYDIVVQPVTDFPGEDETADMARINALVETAVREEPHQYMWVHRRFKTRPPGEAPVYR